MEYPGQLHVHVACALLPLQRNAEDVAIESGWGIDLSTISAMLATCLIIYDSRRLNFELPLLPACDSIAVGRLEGPMRPQSAGTEDFGLWCRQAERKCGKACGQSPISVVNFLGRAGAFRSAKISYPLKRPMAFSSRS